MGQTKRKNSDPSVPHTTGIFGQWGVTLGADPLHERRLVINSIKAIPFVNMGVTYM